MCAASNKVANATGANKTTAAVKAVSLRISLSN